MTDAPRIDWDELRRAAVEVAARAYAPYSGLHVGAAGLTADGDIVVGCNVENASYGMTLCAECSLVSDLVRRGQRRLVAIITVDGAGDRLAPCGRCRQLLHELGGPDLLVATNGEPVPLSDLLPGAFGPEDLPPSS